MILYLNNGHSITFSVVEGDTCEHYDQNGNCTGLNLHTVIAKRKDGYLKIKNSIGVYIVPVKSVCYINKEMKGK